MSALVLLLLASTAAPDSVVVYPDRAQVTRVTQVACGARVPVSFDNIPPAAAADSFRARLAGGTVDGLRAELVTREKQFGPKAEALARQLSAMALERARLQDKLARARAGVRLGQQYSELAVNLVSREMSVENPNVRGWQAAFDGALNTGLSAAWLASETDAKLRDVARREEQLRRQLEEVDASLARRSYTVEVLVSCAAGTAPLTLTYLVGGARWTPVYEARAEEQAGQVELSTYATLQQSTGEDWANVELVLSTAIPAQNATPPELRRLRVNAQELAPQRKVLVRRDELVETAKADTGVEQPSDSRLIARAQGLSVQLQIPERGKVPGDGSPVRLFVGKTTMKAAFELRVLPKLMPVAFRVAELTNQGAWPLLPGRLDAFRPTGLVGRYGLDRVAQGAAFTLTFGVEDSVRVRRVVLEELKRDAGLFNSKRRFTYSYRFELANYAKAPAEVLLADHLPVAEVDDLQVSVGEKTTAGYQLSKAEGIARWKVRLAAGEKKNVTFDFQVDVPQTYETGGL